MISVVTPTFNAVATLGRTIDSVCAQKYPSVEYIVVDGGSRDSTLELLRSRSADIDLWISEPDSGIADAFNKGIALASGENIAIVNADDWLEPEQLRVAVAELERSGADFVFGDMMLHAPDETPVHIFTGERDYAPRLAHSMPHLNHPTVVCRRGVYERFGLFELTWRIALDYEWFCRIQRGGASGHRASGLVGHMSLQGVSDQAAERGFAEVREISVRYGYPAPLAWLRFLVRVAKLRTRRVLERCLPRGAYERRRRRVNENHRSVDQSRG